MAFLFQKDRIIIHDIHYVTCCYCSFISQTLILKMKRTLVDIFNEIGNHTGIDYGQNDKNGCHSYLETYDKLFEPFRDECTLLEIGLAGGDSIDLWDKYFENSTIIGVDITVVFQPKAYRNKVKIIQADATKPDFLEQIEDGSLDLCIDDGDHLTNSQLETFRLLKPKMKPSAIYIIEDLLALDIERKRYEAMHHSVEILDFREVKGRFDDGLVILRDF